jgi:hypothetical protein
MARESLLTRMLYFVANPSNIEPGMFAVHTGVPHYIQLRHSKLMLSPLGRKEWWSSSNHWVKVEQTPAEMCCAPIVGWNLETR